MSKTLVQPIGQKRLTNVAVVRLKKNGMRFEVACYKNKVLSWRSGVEKDLGEVLQSETVYLNVSKAQLAKSTDLEKAFGTTDQSKICLEILEKGELQVAGKERESKLSSQFRDIATIVMEKTINPETQRPYTISMIERLMHEIHFAVDPHNSSKKQALEVIRELQKHFPIKRSPMRLRLTVPEGNLYALMEKLNSWNASIISKDESADQQSVICEIEPGCFRDCDALVRRSAAADGGEIDPLDAFMEGIQEEIRAPPPPNPVKKQMMDSKYDDDEDDDPVESFLKAKKDLGLTLASDALRAGYDSDEEVYAAAKAVDAGMVEYDSDDNPIVMDKRKIEPIPALDHSSIEYNSFCKDFYEEKPLISGMSDQDVTEYRKTLAIRVSGFDVPKPIKAFEDCGFSATLMNAISKQGYEKPTSIQCQALPIVLSGSDIIGIAKTGSGKTVAFVLPMIVHIMDQPEIAKEEGPIGVICAPTRELAHQIYLETKKFAKPHGIRVSAVYGGMSKLDQFKELKAGCEIVVATPGRLIDMLKMKALTMYRATYLVLDEADRMFDLGFEPQIRSIVGQIRPDRQTLLFSATMPYKVERLARESLTDPIRVTVGEVGMANEDITQVVNVIPSDAEKMPWLLDKLPGMIDEGDVLVFASKKATVDDIETQLIQKSFKVAALHGDKDQASRMETLQKFKSGIYHVLVATDVAARGLDIKSIKSVVNFDIARDMDMHVHRIGRTGRAGDKDGTAYTFITQKESRFAGELVNSLIAAGQNVSMELMDLAMKDGRFRSKRDARKSGGKKGGGKGKGGGGGGSGRGVRGVDFGLGIGYKPESSATPSQPIPNRSAAVNSLRTGMMSQFKNNFVAATPSPQSDGRNQAGSRPVLRGFVSGGSIGGESYKAQPATNTSPAGGIASANRNQKLESSRDRPRERKRPSGWDR